MSCSSPNNLAANAVPFHPSLLIEDDTIAGVANAKRYFSRAYENQSKGKWFEAVHDYRNAVVLCPDMFEAYFNMGLCYEKSRDATGAIQAFEQVVHLHDGFKSLYGHLAHLYTLQGNHEKSLHYQRIYRRLQT